jgi:SET domain-containing protein
MPSARRYATAPSPIHGLGVFARQPFAPGDLIGVLPGIRTPRYRPRRGRIFAVELDAGYLVPRALPGGLWLLNHSCQPNAELARLPRSARLIALRAIAPGDEITCDYRPSLHEGQLPCACGTKRCSGFL